MTVKETKKFFENNRLNKGSRKYKNNKQTDSAIIRKKYSHILPPIDMLEQYEDVSPGTIDKLIKMAEKEQENRHQIDLKIIKSNDTAMFLGKIFAIIFSLFICTTTLMVALINDTISAAIFGASSFASIAVISYIHSKIYCRKMYDKNHANENYVKNKFKEKS